MRKKGEVTVFIALGIVIIIILALGIYYRSAILKEIGRIEVFRGVTVPEEIQPIKQFVEDCIRAEAEQGVIILGLQGGSISIPKDTVPLSSANIFSNALAVFPGQELVVPYWRYRSANGLLTSAIPTVAGMQNELNNHISQNIDSCLNDFSGFDDYEIEGGDARIESSIKNDRVAVDIRMPLDIRYAGTTYKLRDFSVDIDARLGSLYALAKQILLKEETDSFFEDKTIDMLVVYDELPYSGTEISCQPMVWSKTNVANSLRKILQQNLPSIKIAGLSHGQEQKYYVWSALGKNYPGVHASVIYSRDWPFFMDVYPSEGELLKSNQISGRFGSDATRFLDSLVCIQDYNFIYDIKYPVLVALRDDKSFNNNGYTFQFAFQVIIDNNQPVKNELGMLEIPEARNICRLASTEATVYAFEDAGYMKPAVDADIAYKCITTLCRIGKTDRNGLLRTKFPQCINGAMIAEKEGLHRGKTIYSTNKEGTVSVVLKPYYELNLNVNLIEKGFVRGITQNEQVIVEMSNAEDEYTTTVIYPDETRIRLIAGKYRIKMHVIDKSPFGIRIEEQELESCVKAPMKVLGIFGLTERRCETVKIPATTLEQVVKGGVEFDYELQPAGASTLTLYVITDETPGSYDELNQIYEKIRGNALKEEFRYPVLA